MRRLSQAGFKRDFLDPAILPDWWDSGCEADDSLLGELEIRVARFLQLSVSAVRDPNLDLLAPRYQGAQLRRVRDIDRDRLAPAIHAGMQIAAAVVRNLRNTVAHPVRVPDPDAAAWRRELQRIGSSVKLEDVLRDLWGRGIPVVGLDVLPTPSFQGLACVVEGRPVVILGHKHDEPSRVAHVVAHEAGHVASGDCAPGQPVVDEDEEVADDGDIETRADAYACRLLVGPDGVPLVKLDLSFKQLATEGARLEKETGADAGAVIFAWARRTGDFQTATMAVKALYRDRGARRKVRQFFDEHVDLEAASESDRSLLRCVYGDPERDATAA